MERHGDETNRSGTEVLQRLLSGKCSFPVCVEITGDRADGGGEINNLKKRVEVLNSK